MSAGTVRVAACLALVAWLSLPAVALPAVITLEAEDEQQATASKEVCSIQVSICLSSCVHDYNCLLRACIEGVSHANLFLSCRLLRTN